MIPFLPFFSATKLLWMAGAVIAIGIGIHTAVGMWKEDIRQKEQLLISNQEKDNQIEEWRTANAALIASHELKDQEVRWARNYVAKQEAALKALRESGDKEFVKCLDVPLPDGYYYYQ